LGPLLLREGRGGERREGEEKGGEGR